METINVYYSFGGSDKNFKITMLSIISLTINNKNNIINIYLLDCGAISEYGLKKTSQEKLSKLKNYVKNSGANVTLHFLDANPLIKKYMLAGPNEIWNNKRYSKISLLYVRYLISFFKVPKKMLWLDTDTLIFKDLSELWNTNIDNHEWAGREDMIDCSKGECKPFLQNGVMLLNIPKISPIFKQIIHDYKKRNYGDMGDMLILNKLSRNKKALNRKFNSFTYTKKVHIWHMCALALFPEKFSLLPIWAHFKWFKYRLKWYSDYAYQPKFNYDNKKIDSVWKLKSIKGDEESIVLMNFPQLHIIYDIYHIYFDETQTLC